MYVGLPRGRLDGGGRHFRRRWGYETATAAATLLEDIDEDAGHDAVDGAGDDHSSAGDTYSLRDEPYHLYQLHHQGQWTSTLIGCAADQSRGRFQSRLESSRLPRCPFLGAGGGGGRLRLSLALDDVIIVFPGPGLVSEALIGRVSTLSRQKNRRLFFLRRFEAVVFVLCAP